VTLLTTRISYNSAVFYIGANNQYDIYAVEAGSENMAAFEEQSRFDRIEGTKWIRIYDNLLVSYGNVVLVIDEYRSSFDTKTATGRPEKWPNVSPAVASDWAGDFFLSYPWKIEGGQIMKPLGTPEVIRNITDTGAVSREWIRFDRLFTPEERENQGTAPTRFFAHVSHTYAYKVDTASRIQLSLTFLIIVIVCNSVKLLAMLWVVFLERQEYIVTLGDGASTFLRSPDPKTERMCILSKPEVVREVAEAPESSKHDDQLARLVTQSGKIWTKQYSTYSNALNRDREIGSYFM
jgi:hypothetical protein